MNTRLAPLLLSSGLALAVMVSCGKESAPPAGTEKAVTPAVPTAIPPPAPAPQEAADGLLTIDVASIQKPWTGDLDGMIERRLIRVLTVNSKTIYFVDRGVQRGTAVDYARLFEEELNKKLLAEKKLKNRNLKVRIAFISVQRDELLPALVAGRGDIAAAGLTITPERRKLVDFSAAGMSNVSEVVVTGPASPRISSLDDLSGKSVFVRKSSSYYENLVALNKKLAPAGNPRSSSRRRPRRWKTRIYSKDSPPAGNPR